ncbi:MAG TPA: aminotransferase class V-fold PLP-dependent enzyme [Chloroflexota bacterium]|nr:aminotransferase class V-fold PLP-dependent enzyme [Chloroflexota bacterium]
MPDIYERLGVRPLINARGTHTRLGGTLMRPEVVAAMQAAAGAYVVLDELQDRASEVIARATGAEAGMVVGGAEAGLLIGTAAILAGTDPAKIASLPVTDGMKNEAIVHRAHRNGYDHGVRAAGAKIVDIGYGGSTLPYQLEAALNEKTALVMYLMSPWANQGALSLAKTCEIAHAANVPVLVDAAAMLPPHTSLTRFIAEGADLVTFSGGKGLMGPQSSGILAGRADLIRAARMNGSPSHSVGRAAKAAKEDIVGLIVALENYLARDHDADIAFWRSQAEYMLERLRDFPGVAASYLHDGREHPVPRVELVFGSETGIDSHQLVLAMEEHDPRIFLFEPTGPSAKPNSIAINTQTMQPGEEKIVAEALHAAIDARLKQPVAVAAR